VAIAGVAGNGQTLLAEAITGGLADYDGRIAIGGRDLRGLTRRQVARLGVGYVPENRTEVGLIPAQSVAINLALRAYDCPPYSRRGWVDRRAVRAEAERLIERYRIQTPSPDTPVGRLSGGNQQRVIVARELSGQPKLIVVDNFTRGLDPRSTRQFKGELFAQRDRGAAIVWITGDLGEALECDRIAVIQRGRIVGLLERAEATREALGLLMSGDEAIPSPARGRGSG
jgi:simple sugar transport system ATP-binding protein